MTKLKNFFRTKSPGDRFYENFAPSRTKLNLGRILLSLALLFVVITGGRLHVIEYDFSRFLEFQVSAKSTEFAFAFLVAVASSLTASFVFLLVIEQRERGSILQLKNYAPDEFYRDFIDNVAHYEGIIRYDHVVEVKLRNHQDLE